MAFKKTEKYGEPPPFPQKSNTANADKAAKGSPFKKSYATSVHSSSNKAKPSFGKKKRTLGDQADAIGGA